MNINYKQSQFELFPQATGGAGKADRPQFFFSSLTFSLENVVIIGISLLMAVVFSFSLGVERGKRFAVSAMPAAFNRSNVATVKNPLPEASAAKQASDVSVNAAMAQAGVIELTKKAETNVDFEQPLPEGEVLSGIYTIQIASFKKDEYAQKEATILRKKGFEIFIVSKGKYSIVCVGKFSKKNDAKSILSRLKKTYKDLIVRRL